MNERMREALVTAALNGVRQIKNQLHDGNGGHCAWGVYHLDLHNGNEEEAVACTESLFICKECLDFWSEYMCNIEIEEANDEKGWDFLTIARKCGVEDDV